jgi:hypothetical protein
MGLVSSDPSEEQVPTAELPKPEVLLAPEPEPERLTDKELEISTADTRPLPADMSELQLGVVPKTDEQEMESKATQAGKGPAQQSERGSGPLLDLGEFEPARAAAEDDFVLDIDFADTSDNPSTDSTYAIAQAGTPPISRVSASVADGESSRAQINEPQALTNETYEPVVDSSAPLATHQEVSDLPAAAPRERAFTEPEIFEAEPLRMVTPASAAGLVTLEQLSPEAIDAIARRAVELLSEKVVEEIAWEVVPQLAELMIKRQLEEKNS